MFFNITDSIPTLTPTGSSNVGIGTTTPSARLTVQGNIEQTDGTYRMSTSTTGAANQVITALQPANAGSFPTFRLSNNGNGSIGSSFEFLSGSGVGSRFLYVNSIGGGAHIFASDVLTSGSALPIKFRIGADWASAPDVLILETNGNVAIGTTTPAARLDVADSSTTSSAIIVPRAGNFTGTNVNGMVRYNTASTLFEFRQNGVWVNYTTVSDGRLKTNVEPVSDGLSIVNQLNPVFYDWDRSNPKATNFEDKHQVGFIAQEVEKVLPEVVNKGEDSYRSIEYGKMVSVVVAAVKQLYGKILGIEGSVENLETRYKVNEREITSVKAENDTLKKENAEMKARLDRIEKLLKVK